MSAALPLQVRTRVSVPARYSEIRYMPIRPRTWSGSSRVHQTLMLRNPGPKVGVDRIGALKAGMAETADDAVPGPAAFTARSEML